MSHIETDISNSLLCRSACGQLPEVVIEMHAACTFFPKARPLRKIKINEMNIGQRFACDSSLNRFTIIGPCNHPDFMVLSGLADRVPAHAWF